MDNLPAELKLYVAEELDPESAYNFASTCRQNYRLFRSILIHHAARYWTWHVIDLDKRELENRADGNKSIWSLAREIIQDPRIGGYVRELSIPETREYNWNSNLPPKSIYEHDYQLFKEAAWSLQDLYPEEPCEISGRYSFVESIIFNLTLGKDDAIIIILLHYLYNLEIISINDSRLELVREFIERIALRSQEPTQSTKLPLRRLHTATMVNFGSAQAGDTGWACSFARFPSMRTFAAQDIYGEAQTTQWANGMLNFPFQALVSSNITEMFLYHCGFGERILNHVLAGMKALRKLTYILKNRFMTTAYNPKQLLRTVVLHTKSSLEELVLDFDHFDQGVC